MYWKEHTDHRIYRYVDVNLKVVLFSITFEFGVGVSAFSFKVQVFAQLSGELSMEISGKRTSPDGDVGVNLGPFKATIKGAIGARAEAGECDVVVKGVFGGAPRGALYAGAGQFETDRSADGLIADATLRAEAATPGQELTFTAVPPGNGRRIGLDRDDDGASDTDEDEMGGDALAAEVLPCVTTVPAIICTFIRSACSLYSTLAGHPKRPIERYMLMAWKARLATASEVAGWNLSTSTCE